MVELSISLMIHLLKEFVKQFLVMLMGTWAEEELRCEAENLFLEKEAMISLF